VRQQAKDVAFIRCQGTKSPLLRALFSLSSFFCPVTFLSEGVIVGFKNFAWGFKSQQKIRFGIQKKWGTPLPPMVDFLFVFLGKRKKSA
jgi:hypothetical protein